MRIQYFSDLHVEDGDVPYEKTDCDVIAILGDLGPGQMAIDWLDKHLGGVDKPIVYVPGNHDPYYGTLQSRHAEFEAACYQMGIDFLYNRAVEIQGVLFLGTTLWTDFNLHNNQRDKMLIAHHQMTDYLAIEGRGVDGKITSSEILAEHMKAIAFLEEGFAMRKEGQQVVVLTHHAPLIESLGEDANNRFAPYYASDLADIIDKYEPELWLHGHIHRKVQYFYGEETLVLCNARGRKGNPKAFNKQFDMRSTVNI
jgi:Icc-related predicted phosphoesterase